MPPDYMIVFAILAGTLILFASGKLRFDYVAILALLTSVFCGVVSAQDAFSGFGHPAVITVAAVLIISKALQNSGVVAYLASFLAPTRVSERRHITASTGLVALLSCFMNNVGALALMLPVTLQNAEKAKHSASKLLMPLSFASLLGGLVTLIGTPTNIVISTYRTQFTGEPYSMFDFTPVGLAVAVVGLIYIATIGWKLLPDRLPHSGKSRLLHVEDYITEVHVPEGSRVLGMSVRELERDCENELAVMAIIRNDKRRSAPSGSERIGIDDTLILEGDPSILEPLIANGNLMRHEKSEATMQAVGSGDVRITEMVLLPNSAIEGQSMRGIKMHDRYGINLLAISRRGEKPKSRLAKTRFKTGDILLLQGEGNVLRQTSASLGLLELAERDLQEQPKRRYMFRAIAIFAAAIILAATGVLTVPIAFVSAVVALIAVRAVNAREVYTSIDWSIIILLGALIPVGDALQTSGGTTLIANAILDISMGLPNWAVITFLMVGSMWLSDVIPNTPTAVLMAPIGATVAAKLGVSPDPFLMAVAIGCATPFLTPIGHQSNTLVMSPGGYRFTDYARMGLGLELVVVVTAVPMIMIFWPV